MRHAECFTLTAPVGTDENFFAGDDADTAKADAFLFWLLPDGTTLVTCDPTNLKTTKVAKGDCEASEGGYRCDYVVTVTNMGTDPYKGPIKLDEQFGFAPSRSSSRRHGAARRRSEFQCRLPHVDLAKGASVELEVTVTVPDGKHCSLRNTAVMTLPDGQHAVQRRGRRRYRFGDGQDPVEGLQEARPAAMRAQRPMSSAARAAPASASRAMSATRMANASASIEPQALPGRQAGAEERTLPVDAPSCEPGPNEERNTQGQCVCKRGFERDQTGVASKKKPQSKRRTLKTNARSGLDWDDKRDRCVPPPNPEDECEKRGWIWDDRTDRCFPPPNPRTNARRGAGSGTTGPIAACPRPTPLTSAGRRAGYGTARRRIARVRSIRPRNAGGGAGLGTASAA